MSLLRRWWPLAVMLFCLAACGNVSSESSGAAEEDTLRSSTSRDGMLTIVAPSSWALTDDTGSGVVLSIPGGGSLEVMRISSGDMNGLTQPEILEGMLKEATTEFEAKEQTIEEVGRRVWLGKNYIWHEIQYIASPTGACGDCRPAFYIDFLAIPDGGGLIRGRYTGADAQTLDEDEEAALTAVIDSITVRTPAST